MISVMVASRLYVRKSGAGRKASEMKKAERINAQNAVKMKKSFCFVIDLFRR